MSSCNYHLINDLYDAMDADLKDIADKIDALDIDVKIDEIDLDLDNIELQLTINNKLRLLELVGIDIMTEQEQTAAYNEIKELLFPEAAEEENQEGE